MDNPPDQKNQNISADLNLEAKNKNVGLKTWILAGSFLLGAVLISASLFYNFNLLFKHLNLGFAQLASSQQAQSAAVPSAVTPPSAPQAAAAGPVNITLAPNTPYLGNDKAKVTVVEFADYQCPFCEEFYKTVWPELKAKYVDTGKIKFVYQDFAFLGADSTTAAEAAHCAEDQGKFWQYHDYLFNNQQEENTGWATAVHQKQFAATLGLNTTQFDQCLDSGKYAAEVAKETAAGKSYGVSGTPSVFVNGQIIVGAEPVTTFEQAIDAALK